MKIKAKKSLGQNFLKNKNIINKILNSSDIKLNDHIVEIGPGLGSLTDEIIKISKNIELIEIDKCLVQYLKIQHKYKNITIHNENILNFNFNHIKLQEPYIIMGNIPYNISIPILFKIIENIQKFKKIIFMLQKEVVDKIISPPNKKNYSKLSIIMQYYFFITPSLIIDPNNFEPKPKVFSQIIIMKPKNNIKPIENFSLFSKILKNIFTYRRKKLKNIINILYGPNNLKIDNNIRAENLNNNEFITLIHNIIKEFQLT